MDVNLVALQPRESFAVWPLLQIHLVLFRSHKFLIRTYVHGDWMRRPWIYWSLRTRNLSALFHRSYLSGLLAFIRGQERKIQTERIWNINKKTLKSTTGEKKHHWYSFLASAIYWNLAGKMKAGFSTTVVKVWPFANMAESIWRRAQTKRGIKTGTPSLHLLRAGKIICRHHMRLNGPSTYQKVQTHTHTGRSAHMYAHV